MQQSRSKDPHRGLQWMKQMMEMWRIDFQRVLDRQLGGNTLSLHSQFYLLKRWHQNTTIVCIAQGCFNMAPFSLLGCIGWAVVPTEHKRRYSCCVTKLLCYLREAVKIWGGGGWEQHNCLLLPSPSCKCKHKPKGTPAKHKNSLQVSKTTLQHC